MKVDGCREFQRPTYVVKKRILGGPKMQNKIRKDQVQDKIKGKTPTHRRLQEGLKGFVSQTPMCECFPFHFILCLMFSEYIFLHFRFP